MEQRWMKNMKTGAIFAYDEAQVASNRLHHMVECDKDGTPLVRESGKPDLDMQRQRIGELEAELNELRERFDNSAVLENELERIKEVVRAARANTETLLAAKNASGMEEALVCMSNLLGIDYSRPTAFDAVADEAAKPATGGKKKQA